MDRSSPGTSELTQRARLLGGWLFRGVARNVRGGFAALLRRQDLA